MKRHVFLLLLSFFGLHVGAQQVVRFDRPTSLQGREIWWKGNEDKKGTGFKPIRAGEGHANPDREWENASLPLGNGSLGCNVMGSVAVERYTLNEKTLWRGGPNTAKGPADYWNQNKKSAHLLPEIREAFARGDWDKAAALTQANFNSEVPYESWREPQFRFGSFTTLGELCIATGHDENTVSDYRRELSVDSAFATVAYKTPDGVTHERRTFVSYPANVIAIRFKASEKGNQNLRITYCPNPLGEGTFSADGKNGVLYLGRLDNNGMQYAVRLQVKTVGGKVTCQDSLLTVERADEAVILLTADTDYAPNYDPDFSDPLAYVGVNPAATTKKWMNKAAKKGFDRLFAEHHADYAALFNRVTFRLGEENASHEAEKMTTPARLAAYRQGKADPSLETLYFAFGRYLLISSSRPGNLPANLQGIWHNNVDGPWRVDYHNNINLQMNYWPALTTNLAECAEPLTDFIRLLEKPGEKTAKDYWGARGWAAGISANIFGFTAPLEGADMSWNYNPMAASWLATHLWEYYDFTRDLRFLKETAWPLMKPCALFCEDFLWRKSDGTLTAAPSTSPEHGPIDEGTTFTHAVIREILLDCIEAARVLKCDTADVARWEKVLRDLAPYRIGRYGQLLEWSRDIDDPNDQHRHVNHLFGLHPGHTISPLTTPELAKASRVVLEHRGDGATGWSMGWKLNLWARLHDGNHSYVLYQNLLKHGTNDNLWDSHPPFQIDGNFGGVAGVTEMLLQSHAGVIDLLPALPDAWADGKITGLRARGNFEVDVEWHGGRLTRAVIRSLSGNTCAVRYASHTLRFPTEKGKTVDIVFDGETLQAVFDGTHSAHFVSRATGSN